MTGKWFMSYCWRYALTGDLRFGHCTTTEHPIDKVTRWNREIKERRTVLTFFCEVDCETIDVDVEN